MGIRRDLMMHAAMMAMEGFPMLSSGDEIGQLNGYDYHKDPNLAEDSRNVHRTPFSWDNAALRTQPGTIQNRIWTGLRQLEQLRAKQPCFGQSATVSTWDTHNRHVLSLVRRSGNDVLVCLFNFTGDTQSITMDALEGTFTDLLTGETGLCSARDLPPYAYAFCLRQGNP
jgi:amylosucrase